MNDLSTEVIDNTTGEIVPAPSPRNAMESMMERLGVTGVKQVTRAVLQQIERVPVAVRFEGASYEGEVLEAAKGAGAKMAPAHLANVVNLNTGERMVLIMNHVLEQELVREYGKPEGGNAKGEGATGGYIDRCFIINSWKRTDAEGKQKRYRDYQIVEIFLEGGDGPENVVSGEKVADTTTSEPKGKAKSKD